MGAITWRGRNAPAFPEAIDNGPLLCQFKIRKVYQIQLASSVGLKLLVCKLYESGVELHVLRTRVDGEVVVWILSIKNSPYLYNLRSGPETYTSSLHLLQVGDLENYDRPPEVQL